MKTLERRAQKLVVEWQKMAIAFHLANDERPLPGCCAQEVNRAWADALDRCAQELARALAVRSTSTEGRAANLARRVKGDGDNLTVAARLTAVMGQLADIVGDVGPQWHE